MNVFLYLGTKTCIHFSTSTNLSELNTMIHILGNREYLEMTSFTEGVGAFSLISSFSFDSSTFTRFDSGSVCSVCSVCCCFECCFVLDEPLFLLSFFSFSRRDCFKHSILSFKRCLNSSKDFAARNEFTTSIANSWLELKELPLQFLLLPLLPFLSYVQQFVPPWIHHWQD